MSLHTSWLCSDCIAEKRVDCALAEVREGEPNARCWEPLRPGTDLSQPMTDEPLALTLDPGEHTNDLDCELCDGACDFYGSTPLNLSTWDGRVVGTWGKVPVGNGYEPLSGSLTPPLHTVADILGSPEAQAQRAVYDFAMEQAVTALMGEPKPRHTYEFVDEVRAGLDARLLRAIDLTQIEGKTMEEVQAMLHDQYVWPDGAMNRILDDLEEELRMDDESVVRQAGRAFRRGVVTGALAAVVVVVVWAAGDRAVNR